MGAPKPVSAADAASGAAKARKTEADIKRAMLAISTLGTSEIQTGAGEYGDETLADSLFPKEINNLFSVERQDARKAADAAKAAELDKLKPGPPPDLTAELIQKAGGNALLRQRTRNGRRSTFLSGGK